jgi:hypothetical protein
MCRGFEQEWQSVPELKAYNRAVLKPCQFLEQRRDRPLQFELIASERTPPCATPTQSRDSDDLHIRIENGLPVPNGHVLDAAELVLAHDFQQRKLRSAKFAGSSHTSSFSITYQLGRQSSTEKFITSVGQRIWVYVLGIRHANEPLCMSSVECNQLAADELSTSRRCPASIFWTEHHRQRYDTKALGSSGGASFRVRT